MYIGHSMHRSTYRRVHRLAVVLAACSVLVFFRSSLAQEGTPVFLPTDDVVGIWEFNDLPVDVFEPVPDGTIVPDLSGNGLDAIVVDNGGGDLVVQEGDPNYEENTGIERIGTNNAARVTVEDDDDAFEMDEEQDFTFELYVTRAEQIGGATWGILAGTWHSRTVIDDGQDGNVDGAWYGWGFIQRGGQPGWLWVMSFVNPDGSLPRTGCCNEQRNDASWEIPPGSHYLVASVDRSFQVANVYLDGELVESLTLSPDWSFITPEGHEHANLTFLTGVDDTSRGAFRRPPTGFSIDSARVLRRVMEPDEVLDNWFNIQDGVGVPPEEEPVGGSRRAGDVNGDGNYNITDPVAQLNFQFGSQSLPDCYVVPDSDPPELTEAGLAILDFNGDGNSNISDAVASLSFQFGGGSPPALGDGCVQIPGMCESNCTP